MQLLAYILIVAGWLLWVAPFFLFKANSPAALKIDPRARWGIVFVGLSYSMLWQGRFWERPVAFWQYATAIAFFVLAALLSWTARQALGRQWRLDAGLNADHELVTAGPYQLVRHPIYTSMLCVFLGTGVLVTPWWLLLISLAVSLLGTEIRVRVEDRLLASHFGETFFAYRRKVSAYIPFLR